MAKLQSSPTVGGSLILLARLKAGLTQQELATQVGTAAQVLLYHECEVKTPSWPLLAKLIRVLGVALVDIDNTLASVGK